ncbi:hypothetical protein CYA_1225 [Synechococcus sp. JA-3-3Ab]|jgi:hypothetical protein|nr:hypothetical protein CYA_1225 [Synechococcus sp. JA-3-3Ab]
MECKGSNSRGNGFQDNPKLDRDPSPSRPPRREEVLTLLRGGQAQGIDTGSFL